VEYLLLRRHVSAFELGHYRVSNCVSEETIQSSTHIAHITQLHLVHKHALFTHRVYAPDRAFDLEFMY